MTRYQVERFHTIEHELEPLFERHWEEIALDKETIPLEPDWDRYRAIDDADSLIIVTARDGDVLVGYAFWFVLQALHYKSLKVADSDMFFLLPEHRKGWTGVRLIRESERALSALGVQKMFAAHKLHHDVGAVFDHLGWRPIERLYAKTLKE